MKKKDCKALHSANSELMSVVSWSDYWGSNGRRESQGSLSSGTSVEMSTSCPAGKIEVRFFGTNHHGYTMPSKAITHKRLRLFFKNFYLSSHSFLVRAPHKSEHEEKVHLQLNLAVLTFSK